MRVTPLDILQKRFSPGRRGVDPDEVHAFLEEVRESLEEVLKENQSLKDLLLAREKEIATLRENELGIKDTLLLARQLAADVRRAAHKEADVIVGEARLEAERVIASGHDEQRRTLEQILRLRALRQQYLAHVRALLQSQDRILQEIESDATLPLLDVQDAAAGSRP
ncbi:MAG: DivIVA domain-containing protein [Deltaproteobacteria bacterium]|nr:DivIVA domain-containing protein [Deltaproteobacteria bacterium]